MLYYSQRRKQNRKWEGTNFHETHTTQTLRLPDQLRPGDLRRHLIIRDLVYFGKKTYGEFLASGA